MAAIPLSSSSDSSSSLYSSPLLSAAFTGFFYCDTGLWREEVDDTFDLPLLREVAEGPPLFKGREVVDPPNYE